MTTDPQTPVSELEGRELDAAVAEEVFGWKVEWRDKPPFTVMRYVKPDGDAVHPDNCPHYSTDIAAAWEVVGEVGGGITIWHGADKFRVCWTDNYSSALEVCQHTHPDVTADTAPEAICRAALRAVRD